MNARAFTRHPAAGEAAKDARIAELEAEVTYWKGQAGVAVNAEQVRRLALHFKITGNEALIILALHARTHGCSIPQLEIALPAANHTHERASNFVSARISVLRKKLGAGAILIVRGFGYVLSPDMREHVGRLLVDLALEQAP